MLSGGLAQPEGGKVALVAEESEAEIISIHVQDTGIGIAEADMPHIFERFYRAPSSQEMQSGSGLGLAVAQQITQLHGGSIKVSSQINQGSQFTIALPYSDHRLQLISAGRFDDEDSNH